MPFSHGKNAEVVADQYDFTTVFKDASFGAEADTAETTAFRQDDKSYVSGLRSSTLSLDGFYDTVVDPLIHARLSSALQPIATFGPAGLAPGARARLIKANATSIETSSPVNDVVAVNWELQSTERIGLGHALVGPTTNLVGNTNGTAVDTGAAVTGPWVFHAHVHALSATNVTVKVQDSADGSTGWTDVTGVTSGALSSPSAIRVTGTGAVRRYIRVVSTFVGGATTANITAAFARSAS